MPDGRTYKHHKYDNIVKEQVIISYMSNGTISIQDLDEMCPYDRKLVANTLKEIKDEEKTAMGNATGMRRSSRTSRF